MCGPIVGDSDCDVTSGGINVHITLGRSPMSVGVCYALVNYSFSGDGAVGVAVGEGPREINGHNAGPRL